MPELKEEVKLNLGYNILVRQNLFEEVSNHMKRYSLWKIKEIKRFFAHLFMVPFNIEDIAKKLQKKTYCCKVLFDMNCKTFELSK